ncbi:response regulator transcription factor [Winogradskyella poriferorum]|uniref:LuxR C-terminal-related transcriptional regulator n=1 Tax=Winogradskyella poriferorum TaxID=307627 RepID=A0ABU7W9U7_9FLAO
MYYPSKTAKNQLLKLISIIENEGKMLTTNELIVVLENMKCICKSPEIVSALTNSLKLKSNNNSHNRSNLTNREKQVVLLIGQGLPNKDIAHELNLSKSTIETHRKNIRKKLKIKGKDSLMVFAIIYKLQNETKP